MSALLSLVVLLAAPDGGYSPPVGPAASQAAPSRMGRELEQAVRAALRHWAKPAKDEAETAAREFLGLYEELQRDTALARSVRQELGGKVRGRLAGLARQIAKQAAADQPASVGHANQGGALAQRAGGGPGLGGLGAGGGFGPPASAAARDAGEDLAELIQRVIRPSSWERNGGPGTIRYWPPGRALVARASDDVHGRMADLIDLLDGLGH